MSDQIIACFSQSLAKEQSLESLVRQLLEMLEMVTDMESTYLTKVDVEARLQHIMFARNSQKMHIPENFTVSWDYSLCKRAIDENCFFSDEVPDRWGDCVAARNLGITTFLSTPIHLPDGSFYGTLCAASSEKRQWSERAEQVLQLFAGLISSLRERIQQQIRGEYHLGDVDLYYPGASLGIVEVDPETTDADSALHAADIAMYQEKKHKQKTPFVTHSALHS